MQQALTQAHVCYAVPSFFYFVCRWAWCGTCSLSPRSSSSSARRSRCAARRSGSRCARGCGGPGAGAAELAALERVACPSPRDLAPILSLSAACFPACSPARSSLQVFAGQHMVLETSQVMSDIPYSDSFRWGVGAGARCQLPAACCLPHTACLHTHVCGPRPPQRPVVMTCSSPSGFVSCSVETRWDVTPVTNDATGVTSSHVSIYCRVPFTKASDSLLAGRPAAREPCMPDVS